MRLPEIAEKDQAPLAKAEEFLFREIQPAANAIDQNLATLVAAIDRTAEEGLLGLRVPVEFGGLGISDQAFRRFQETSARCSGAFAFLQTQHQSACAFVASSRNAAVRDRLLPALARGQVKAGIAFSQLRRQGKPMLVAVPDGTGYRVSGVAPWFTGWGIFGHCVVAATLDSGESIWAVIDLAQQEVKASPVMRLAALEVDQTVSLTISELFVAESDVIHVREPDWIQNNDMLNIALQSPFALGCAAAGIDVMRLAHEKKPIPEILESAQRLSEELDDCRNEAYGSMDDPTNPERSLNARAWAIALAGRCAHAGVVSMSGTGNSMESSAQRVYREALVFSVSAQTQPILEATLRRLSRISVS